jgi:CheY-like chemotaxis protein
MAHGRVLVVDDEEDIRSLMASVLDLQGYQVDQAADGASALALLRNGNQPSLILLDLMMPGMNGWQLLEVLHADPRLRKIPVVLVSGAGDLATRASALGVAGYLRKPFDLEALVTAVTHGFHVH